jgi:hypothetical protein
VLETPGIALFIDAIGLLDFDVIFQTDHRAFFIDINMVGFFRSRTEALPAQRFRQMQLEDTRVATEYRRILHQQDGESVDTTIASNVPRQDTNDSGMNMITGLSLMKKRMEEIDNQREAFTMKQE